MSLSQEWDTCVQTSHDQRHVRVTKLWQLLELHLARRNQNFYGNIIVEYLDGTHKVDILMAHYLLTRLLDEEMECGLAINDAILRHSLNKKMSSQQLARVLKELDL